MRGLHDPSSAELAMIAENAPLAVTGSARAPFIVFDDVVDENTEVIVQAEAEDADGHGG